MRAPFTAEVLYCAGCSGRNHRLTEAVPSATPGPPESATPVRSAGARALCWLFWLAWALFSYLYVDTVRFGPIEAQTFEASQAIAELEAFSIYGESFRDRFSLPALPAYVFAPVALLSETPAAVHRWVWLVTMLALALAMLSMWRHVGGGAAALFVAIAPAHLMWLTLGAASGAALLFPIGCLLLAALLSSRNGSATGAFSAGLLVTLAPALHPVALALVPGVLLAMATDWRRRMAESALLGILVGIAVWLPWLIAEGLGDGLQFKAATSALGDALALSPLEWLSPRKWFEWALQPFLIVHTSPSFGETYARSALILQVVILIGAVVGVIFSQLARWLMIPVGIYLLIAVGLLSRGSFWQVDVVLPLLAAQCAVGLGTIRALATWLQGLVAVALLTVNLGMSIHLRDRWHDLGRLRLAESSLSYPRLPVSGTRPWLAYSRAHEIYRGIAAAAIPRERVAGADHNNFVRYSGGWYEQQVPVGDVLRDLRCAVVVDETRWQVPELVEHAPGSIDAGRITGFLLPRCEVYGPGDLRVSADGRLLSVSEPTILMAFMACDVPTADAGARLLSINGERRADVQRRKIGSTYYHTLTWSLSPRRGPFRYREPVNERCFPAGPAVAFPRRQISPSN